MCYLLTVSISDSGIAEDVPMSQLGAAHTPCYIPKFRF